MSLPVGTVVGMIGQNPSSPPAGWLYCNGSTFDSQQYPELAKIFSNNTLPNLTGLTLIGASQGKPYPPSNLGNGGGTYQNSDGTYGSATHTMSIWEMPSHQHFGFGESSSTWPLGTTNYDEMGSKGGIDYDNRYYGTTFAGGTDIATTGPMPNNAFALMQASYAIYFFICASSDNANDALVAGVDDV
jgi:microcystin-dependent protein